MKNLIIALLLILLVLAVLLDAAGARGRSETPTIGAAVTQADYSRCVTIRNGPLIAPRPGIRGLHNHPEIS